MPVKEVLRTLWPPLSQREVYRRAVGARRHAAQKILASSQPIPAAATAFRPKRANKNHESTTPTLICPTADIQVTYAMVGAGLGYTVTNAINSSPQDTAVRHLPIEPPEIIEIGLAHCRDAAPAVKSFLKFIRPQLPAAPQTAL